MEATGTTAANTGESNMNNTANTATFTAWFPLVERAKSFTARITEPGWWATNVVQKGRTVTFEVDVETLTDSQTTLAEYACDMRQTVGYYGSDERRFATLDGVWCGMQW